MQDTGYGRLSLVGDCSNPKGLQNIIGKSSKELDLRDQSQVESFVREEAPDIIIDAAKVGGILANNNYPYEFLMDNMLSKIT